MRFQCPFCSYIITADDSTLGKKSTCPSCEQNIVIPQTNRQENCVIGDFILREKLGSGSLATVFKSVQISLGREVALKVLSNEYTDAKGVLDFLKEARAAAKLNHPNLVQAYAVGEEKGTCYLAMDYVKGKTLKDVILSDEEIPIDKALHIIQQVAEALYYAWEEAEMIHRDVKPDNIMINLEGMAKLTDLGLAMNKSDWHKDMDISGSPSYMSTEQFAGEELDTRSDIYSLGVTLYQILTRKLPFDGATIRTIAKQHFQEEAIPVNKLDKNIPAPVANLVKKMIAKSPDDRFNDMEELLKAIWQIRQKTAPSTEMIPNVHTISIKRLEYDIQSEKVQQKQREVEKERQVEAKIKSENKSIRLLFKGSIIAIILLAVSIGYHFINMDQQQKASSKFNQKISNFEKMVLEKSISKDDYSELKSIADELKSEAKMLNSDNEEGFYARIDLILSNAEKKMLNQRLMRLNSQRSSPNKLKSDIKNHINTEKKLKSLMQTTQVLQNLQTANTKEVNKLETKLTDMKTMKDKLESTKKQQFFALKKLKNKLLNNWKNTLLLKVYGQIKNYKFDVAKGFISIEMKAISNGKDKTKIMWLENLQRWVNNVEVTYNKITSNGTKKIKNNNMLKKTASIRLLLLGKPIAAAIASPNDKELMELSNAVLKDKIVSIQAYSYADETKDKARLVADELLNQLNSTDLFNDVKLTLKKLKSSL